MRIHVNDVMSSREIIFENRDQSQFGRAKQLTADCGLLAVLLSAPASKEKQAQEVTHSLSAIGGSTFLQSVLNLLAFFYRLICGATSDLLFACSRATFRLCCARAAHTEKSEISCSPDNHARPDRLRSHRCPRIGRESNNAISERRR